MEKKHHEKHHKKHHHSMKDPKSKIATVMEEAKRGTLHSGSGAKVKSHKQAVAIALSEARKAGEHIKKPKKMKHA